MEIVDALGQGLAIIMEPHRLLLLWAGVLCGLALGILPGIGGVAGTALLLPFTFSHGPARGDGAAARPRRHDNAWRSDLGHRARRARPRGVRRDGARRLPDDQARRGRARARRRLHVGADGRSLRRRADGGGAADRAPDDPLHRLAGTAGAGSVRHFDGRRAVGQHAAARPDHGLLRHHAGDDRLRSADRHAALDAWTAFISGKACRSCR